MRGLPVARQDIVPGVPRQSPSPRALEAAREAVRRSSPEVHDVQIEALGDRVDALEARVNDISQTHNRVADSVDSLAVKVSEWELVAAGSENIKIQEEGKTKRLSVIVGLLTVALNAAVSIGVNVMLKPPAPAHVTPLSPTDAEILDCREKHRTDLNDQAKCINDIVLSRVTAPER